MVAAMLDLLLYAFLPAVVGATGACAVVWVMAKIWDLIFGGGFWRPKALKR